MINDILAGFIAVASKSHITLISLDKFLTIPFDDVKPLCKLEFMYGHKTFHNHIVNKFCLNISTACIPYILHISLHQASL